MNWLSRLLKSPRNYQFALLFFLFLFLRHAYTIFRSTMAVDYFQFWVVPEIFKAGLVDEVYSVAKRPKAVDYFLKAAQSSGSAHQLAAAEWRANAFHPAGTPFLYMVFDLFSSNNYARSYEFFRIFSLLAFFGGILLFGRAVDMVFLVSLPLLVVLSEWYGPFKSDIYLSGNTNFIQVGFLSLIPFLARHSQGGRTRMALGFSLALLLFFKPNIIYAVLLLFLHWSLIEPKNTVLQKGLGFVAGSLAALAAPVLFFKTVGIWSLWRTGFGSILDLHTRHDFLRFLSISCWDGFYYVIGLTMVGLVGLGIIIRRKPFREVAFSDPALEKDHLIKRETLMIGLGLVIYLLSGRLIHDHYFLLALPLWIYVIRPVEFYEKEALVVGLKARHVLSVIAFLCMAGPYEIKSFYGASIIFVVALWDLFSNFTVGGIDRKSGALPSL